MSEFTETFRSPAKQLLQKLVPQIYKILGIKSVMNIPLVSNGVILGLVDISSTKPFSKRDLKRFAMIAEQLTLAIKRKQSEDHIKLQNEFLNSTLESLTHPFYVIDAADYTIQLANSATGFDNLAEKRTCYQVTHNRKKPCSAEHACPLEIVKKTKKPAVTEHIHYDKNGNKRNVEVHGYPIFDNNGNIVQMIEYSLDITERKKAEKALNGAFDELSLIHETLGVVGKLTRHDVRNKLSAVTGNIYLAKQALPLDHESVKYLNETESAVNQIERIFDFARTYEQLGIEDLSYVDVGKSFSVAGSLLPGLGGIKLVNDCKGLSVLADSLLRQLFYNLMDNSIRHGEKVSRLRIYHKVVKDGLKLVYEDNGVGIPEDEKEKIFTKGYGKGTGIGLHMVKIICEVYGWTIKETGKPGKGAQFTMTIPKTNKSGKTAYNFINP